MSQKISRIGTIQILGILYLTAAGIFMSVGFVGGYYFGTAWFPYLGAFGAWIFASIGAISGIYGTRMLLIAQENNVQHNK